MPCSKWFMFITNFFCHVLKLCCRLFKDNEVMSFRFQYISLNSKINNKIIKKHKNACLLKECAKFSKYKVTVCSLGIFAFFAFCCFRSLKQSCRFSHVDNWVKYCSKLTFENCWNIFLSVSLVRAHFYSVSFSHKNVGFILPYARDVNGPLALFSTFF